MTDRYISFKGISCDKNAAEFMQFLRASLDTLPLDDPWLHYFQKKLIEKQKMMLDDLMFVGGQLNPLREYLQFINSDDGLQLLDKIEFECC